LKQTLRGHSNFTWTTRLINENLESQIGFEVNVGSLRFVQVQWELPAN